MAKAEANVAANAKANANSVESQYPASKSGILNKGAKRGSVSWAPELESGSGSVSDVVKNTPITAPITPPLAPACNGEEEAIGGSREPLEKRKFSVDATAQRPRRDSTGENWSEMERHHTQHTHKKGFFFYPPPNQGFFL